MPSCAFLVLNTSIWGALGYTIARQLGLDVFSNRKDKPGVYYNEVTDAITAGQRFGIQLTDAIKRLKYTASCSTKHLSIVGYVRSQYSRFLAKKIALTSEPPSVNYY